MGKKLCSKRGMTLMELLVSLALMALVAAGVSSGISAGGMSQRDSLALSESSLLLDSVTKAIIGELRFATDMKSLSSATALPTPLAGYEMVYASLAEYHSAIYGENTRFYTAKESSTGMPRIFVEVKYPSLGKTVSSPILGEGTYSNMGAELTALDYDASTGELKVQLAIVLPDGTRQQYPVFQVYPVLQP